MRLALALLGTVIVLLASIGLAVSLLALAVFLRLRSAN